MFLDFTESPPYIPHLCLERPVTASLKPGSALQCSPYHKVGQWGIHKVSPTLKAACNVSSLKTSNWRLVLLVSATTYYLLPTPKLLLLITDLARGHAHNTSVIILGDFTSHVDDPSRTLSLSSLTSKILIILLTSLPQPHPSS